MTLFMMLTLLSISLACAFYGTNLMLWTVATAVGILLFAVSGSVSLLRHYWIIEFESDNFVYSAQ